MKRAIFATLAAMALALSSGCTLVGGDDPWWDEDDFASSAPHTTHAGR
ncbi:MAG: hypothetical protein QM773_19625 [Hyphomonadaceae bacterium]